jgi:Mycobacterial cell wall arabinan synthesis protein
MFVFDRSRPRLFVAAAAAVLAFAGATVALVSDAHLHQSRTTWRPARDGDRPFALIAGYPQSLRITTECSTIRLLPAGATIVRTAAATESGLALIAGEHAVDVTLGAQTLLSETVPAHGRCQVAARFGAHGTRGSFSLRIGDRSVHRIVGHRLNDVVATEATWPRIVRLVADPTIATRPDVVVRLEATPTGSSPSAGQLLAVVVAIMALAVCVVALIGVRRRRLQARIPTENPSPLLVRTDLIVVGVTAVALVVTPAFWDDGWVRATLDGFPKLGAFSNYYTQADFPQPLGYWWAWLTRAWSGSAQSLLLLRLAPLALVVSSWWTLRRWVLDPLVSPQARSMVHAVAALAFCVGSASYLMTLRPEPLVAFVETLTLVAVVRFWRAPGPAPLLALAVLGALAVTAHQTGSIVVLTATAIVAPALRWACERDRLERVTTLVVVTIFGGTLGVLLLGLDSDWRLVRAGVASFRAGDSYRSGITDVPRERYDYLVNLPGLQRYWVAFAVVIALVWVFVGLGVRARTVRGVGYACALGYGGLLFTSSPWPWHFGALVTASTVLAAFTVMRLLEWRRVGTGLLIAMAVAGSLGLSWALASTKPWTLGDLVDHTWDSLPRPAGWQWLVMATTAAMLGMLAGRLYGRARGAQTLGGAHAAQRGAVIGAAVLLVGAPLALTWGFLMFDAAGGGGWSYTRQTFESLTGNGGCGVADSIPVVAAARRLDALPAAMDPAPMPPAPVDGFPPTPSAAAVPFKLGVWGTFGTSTAGATATPWFEISSRGEVAFWSVGGTDAPNRLTTQVLVGSRGRSVVRRSREPELNTPWWAFHRVRLPRAARAVRFALDDGTPGDTSWLAVTAPVAPRFRSFTALTRDQPVWRNPNEVLAMPCRRLPSPAGGLYESFRFSLQYPGQNGAAIAAEYPSIELGCLHARGGVDPTDPRFCAFELFPT